MRGQKRGTCKTCNGPIHFYPQSRHIDGDPIVGDDDEIAGDWAHLNAADWITNPHAPDPIEEPAA